MSRAYIITQINGFFLLLKMFCKRIKFTQLLKSNKRIYISALKAIIEKQLMAIIDIQPILNKTSRTYYRLFSKLC